MGKSNILSLSSSKKSASDRTMNSSKRGSYTEGFWVLVMKSGRKEKAQDLQALRVTLLVGKAVQLANPVADKRSNKKQVFQVRCLSKDNFKGSYGRWVKLL